MSEDVVITCALTGVLTNPKQHPVPVTPAEMAAEARRAYDEGAAIVHVHYRDQREGMGHLPTWDPEICGEINDAIRAACPGSGAGAALEWLERRRVPSPIAALASSVSATVNFALLYAALRRRVGARVGQQDEGRRGAQGEIPPGRHL